MMTELRRFMEDKRDAAGPGQVNVDAGAGADAGAGLPSLAEAGVSIRLATQDDFAFIDGLQKTYNKALGFQFEQAIRRRIEQGHVLIAAARESGEPVGYCIGTDRYFKRDDVGIVYQMAIVPGMQRRLIAAQLLRAQFERSAYGCRLYCCWCAQDLAANRFWEAMGFVPLAFRTGGGRRKKDGPRMHIFWQKRIRAGDTGDAAAGGTAYWFPSQTGGGAIGEDRLVLPIRPGTHWSDVKPVVLPEGSLDQKEAVKRLDDEVARLQRERKAAGPKTAKAKPVVPGKRTASVEAGGLHFGTPGGTPGASMSETEGCATAAVAERERKAALDAQIKDAKQAARKAKQKFDPAQVAFARELKDRWLEQVQARPGLLAGLERAARYDVRRIAGNGEGSVVKGEVRIEAMGVKRLAA